MTTLRPLFLPSTDSLAFVLVPPIPSTQQKQGTLFTLGQVTLSVSIFFLKSKSQIKWLEMEHRVMVSGLGKGAGECGSNG